MLFVDVVATSAAVAAVSSRTDKRDTIAELLARLDDQEIEPAVGYLTGEVRQGRIGVGWRTLDAARQPAASRPSLTILDVDRCLSSLAGLTGSGSAGARRTQLAELLARATPDEESFLVRLIGGELRQGASSGVMTDAVAQATGIPSSVVRRAVMLGGRLDVVARLALTGGRDAVAGVGLELGSPIQPMLASTAPSVGAAIEALGEVSVQWKLDGIRIQVHRDGDDVRVWSRNLNDLTDRLPEVVQAVRELPATALVLDGEALGMTAEGRPVLFQDTLHTSGDQSLETGLRPYFFDVLHLDGDDLVDAPLSHRLEQLAAVAPTWRIPGTLTDDPASGEDVLAESLAAGHEGVVVKAARSTYEAGRRGKAWQKVKPVHTLDLVVLAAEWGHGRRRGWLSNIHLGARAADGDGFVMVGKTFKGMTDQLLAWQTDRFTALSEREELWDGPRTGVVWVRPEQVVEVAIDGVQRSTRYPGGVALRFARVVRYRDDKHPSQVDSILSLRDMLAGGP